MRIREKWWLCCLPLWAGVALWTGIALSTRIASAEEDKKPDAPAAVKEFEAGDLKLSVPEGWQSQKPSNNLRLAQFAIPAVEGDAAPAELVISPPIGGTREANITRWVDQFEREGRELVMSQGQCPQGEYVLVQLSGTYKRSIGPPVLRKTEPAPDYRMHGVILTAMKDGKSVGNYFLKLTGPAKTVSANDAALRAAIGADKSKEEKYELP